MKKKSKTVSLSVHFWRSDPPGTSIKVGSRDFVILVRKDPTKRAGHPALWRELDKLLRKKNL